MKKVISINKEMKENGIVTIPLENGDAVIDFDIENDGELTKEESERIWVTIKNCYDEDGERMEDFKIFMSLKELNDEADGVIVEL
jgi:hypothetical protein